MKLKIALPILLLTGLFFTQSCSKLVNIEKKINSIEVIMTMDPTDSGEFSYQTVQTNALKAEIEKAGIKIDKIKSIKAVVDSVVILNPNSPVVNFGYFNYVKVSVSGAGFEEKIITEQANFPDPNATTIYPAMKADIDWVKLLNSEGDVTYRLNGSMRIKTPLKKDMKYCVSFYVSLSE